MRNNREMHIYFQRITKKKKKQKKKKKKKRCYNVPLLLAYKYTVAS